MKSHRKESEIYRFSQSAPQNPLHRPTMEVDIFEDFKPPSKKFSSYAAAFISDWWDKSCCAKYFSKNGKIAYMGDSGSNLSLLFFHSLTYHSKRKNLLLRKSLHLTVKFLTILHLKKSKNAHKLGQLFHSRKFTQRFRSLEFLSKLISNKMFDTTRKRIPNKILNKLTEFIPNKIFNTVKLFFIKC